MERGAVWRAPRFGAAAIGFVLLLSIGCATPGPPRNAPPAGAPAAGTPAPTPQRRMGWTTSGRSTPRRWRRQGRCAPGGLSASAAGR